MSKPAAVVLAQAPNWEALYLDGLLTDQGPLGYLEGVVRALAEHGEVIERREVDARWLADEGAMPEALERVQFSISKLAVGKASSNCG